MKLFSTDCPRLHSTGRLRIAAPLSILLLLCGAIATALAADDAADSIASPGRLILGKPIRSEEMKQAQDALREKMSELETNSAATEIETDAPPTVKLIFPFPDPKDLPPPQGPAEALRRKLDELSAAESVRAAASNAAASSLQPPNGPLFNVDRYELAGVPAPLTNSFVLLEKHIGTNVSVDEIAAAAADLQNECRRKGEPPVSVAFSPKEITNGVVTFNLFRAPSPQIVIAGERYEPPVVDTNPPQMFPVRAYEITGDTLLPEDALRRILGAHTGTNVGVADVLKAGSELQLEYRTRGYPTVNVTIPPQQITNGIVKLRVFEGKLANVIVENKGRVYYNSNNVMRALPGLRIGEVLLGPVFQMELDRANANQDRQIYPQIAPGPRENTSSLILDVRDRLPLHGKLELNNQNSPGTPELRINASAAYNNLWELEHSLGVQYSFSPEFYKSGGGWASYDQPLVANYSAIYRMPIGSQEAVADQVSQLPGTFGYSEARRRFELPPPSGRAEMTLYGSRSTIDTGVTILSAKKILTVPGVITVNERDDQQDLTVNNTIGARVSSPMDWSATYQGTISGGADFKTYELKDYKTNNFLFAIFTRNANGDPNPPVYATVPSLNPPPDGLTFKRLEYLPLSLRYDGTLRDAQGSTSFGLGISANAWMRESVADLQQITGSRKSSGHWLIFTPSITRDFLIRTNWVLTLHADAQWANEPLISNEQYGLGGVGSIRGYREGESFGDKGWRAGCELKTPPLLIGRAAETVPVTVRGSVFSDCGQTFLIDPQGRDGQTTLWGCGFGGAVSVGAHWDARFIFGWPLTSTAQTGSGQPRFNFALSGQF